MNDLQEAVPKPRSDDLFAKIRYKLTKIFRNISNISENFCEFIADL